MLLEKSYQETKLAEKQEVTEANDDVSVSESNVELANNDKCYLVIAENQLMLDQLMSADVLSADMISVCHGAEFKKKCDMSYELNLCDKTHFEKLFDSLVDAQITDVIRLYSSDEEENNVAHYSQDTAISTLHMVQTLLPCHPMYFGVCTIIYLQKMD